jgi:hypothetical protein
VDDSVAVRRALGEALEREPDLSLAGRAERRLGLGWSSARSPT